MPTVSLRAFACPLRFDVHPLARLHADGRLDLEGPAWPPEGPLVVALWRPGEQPAFSLARVRVRRTGAAWRAEPGQDAWVVAWGPEPGVFEPRAPDPPS